MLNRQCSLYSIILLIQREEDEEPIPYFIGNDFDEKIEDYYNKEDNTTDLYEGIVKKVTTILAFWFFNQASSPDEFNKLIEDVEKGEV